MPVPQIQEQIVEAAENFLQERTSEHNVEQFAGVPVPQVQELFLEVAEITPRRRISERTVGQIDDVPVPQLHEQIVEVDKNIPQEHFSVHTAEQTVDVTAPQILEEIVEAGSAPHERIQQCSVEHVATVKTAPRERISERISVQIVDAPIPHQPGDQACPHPAVTRRQGGRLVCCDTVTGPLRFSLCSRRGKPRRSTR